MTKQRIGMDWLSDLFLNTLFQAVWDSGTANTYKLQVSSVNFMQFKAYHLLQSLVGHGILIYYKIQNCKYLCQCSEVGVVSKLHTSVFHNVEWYIRRLFKKIKVFFF